MVEAAGDAPESEETQGDGSMGMMEEAPSFADIQDVRDYNLVGAVATAAGLSYSRIKPTPNTPAELDVVEMVKKGHHSFGFEHLPSEKQNRLAELLASNQQGALKSGEKREMEVLLAEEQALQVRNLETVEKRLLS